MKYLKRIKKLLALTVSAAMLTLLPNANVLTVSADEPAAYYCMFNEDDGYWRFQEGYEWDADAQGAPVVDLPGKIKNGDVVIVGNGGDKQLTINVHLSDLSIINTSGVLAMVSVAGGIDNCFIYHNSSGSVTGSITNAHVYGSCIANFNNNVVNLYSHQLDSDTGPTVGVTGTVSYFMDENEDGTRGYYGTNFAANSFKMENGELKTASEKYTQDISGGPGTSAAQSANTTQQTTSGSSSNEYDAVPKTGESSLVLWLCLAAAVCFSGGLLLRKPEK